MTKQDFLDGLRRSLSAGLEPEQINEHIRYYSDYIDSQIRAGVAEEEVMTSLGEPRWIAKTILGMEEAELVNGSRVPIGRSYADTARKQLMRYMMQ